MAKWFLRKPDVNIELMSEALGLSPILCTLLANRGLKTKNTAISFLKADKNLMHDPKLMKDMDKAIEILKKNIDKGVKIAIYGDYDVDGVMSTTILFKGLSHIYNNIIYHIPQREEEGYGLNMGAIKRLCDEDVKLIITCDNGISAMDEIRYAKELGLELIVVDHHEPAFLIDDEGNRYDNLPIADAIIDPKQSDCGYPFKLMCAGGLAYKFINYFYKTLETALPLDNELLIFAGIATICDIVDLIDENRIIAKNALAVLNSNMIENLGLKSLIQKRQLVDKTLGTFEIGFIIGPCINATGRLETAKIAVELFISNDAEKIDNLSQNLVDLNEERKSITSNSVEVALDKIKNSDMCNNKVIVFYDPQINESVAGIVAGRIKEDLYRPTIVITDSGDLAKGSGRSIEGYNIFEELYKCKHLFEKFGGHAMAAGFSLKKENIQVLSDTLNNNCEMTDADFVPTIRIDKQIRLEDVTYNLANELLYLGPYGKENKEPIFGTKAITANMIEIIGQTQKTLRFVFTTEESGRTIKAVCFNKVEYFKQMVLERHGQRMLDKFSYGRLVNIDVDIVYQIEINEYNNNKYVNIKIVDFRLT